VRTVSFQTHRFHLVCIWSAAASEARRRFGSGTGQPEQPSYGPATRAGVVSRMARIRNGIGTAKAVPRPLALSPQSKGNSRDGRWRKTTKVAKSAKSEISGGASSVLPGLRIGIGQPNSQLRTCHAGGRGFTDPDLLQSRDGFGTNGGTVKGETKARKSATGDFRRGKLRLARIGEGRVAALGESRQQSRVGGYWRARGWSELIHPRGKPGGVLDGEALRTSPGAEAGSKR